MVILGIESQFSAGNLVVAESNVIILPSAIQSGGVG